MKLKLLGPTYKSSFKNYRGVERPTVSYVAEVTDEHEANQTFYKYLHLANEQGVLQDLQACREWVEVYKRLTPPLNFEIVELTTFNQAPISPVHQFLGFDIACVYRISLLSWGLEFNTTAGEKMECGNEIRDPILPLLQLIEAYFKPQLNKNGLFDTCDAASFCLKVMLALQDMRPNLWEGDDCKFEVLGLWLVT